MLYFTFISAPPFPQCGASPNLHILIFKPSQEKPGIEMDYTSRNTVSWNQRGQRKWD